MTKEYTDTEICLKCVDENEILYDESGKYLDKIKSMKLECPEKLYEDILKNLSKCKDVLFMSLKQRIIMNESGVRLNAKNDTAGLQAKIADITLPVECKNYLRDVSHQGYKILKENDFFTHLVEFDAERSANVKIFGKKAVTVGSFDILAIIDEAIIPHKTIHQDISSKMHKAHNAEPVEHTKDGETDSDFDNINDTSMTDTISETTISSKSMGKAVLTVIITARNYISTLDIFRQFIFMYLQNLSRFFFLVFHIGPLVEKEEIVLYEYKPPKLLVKYVKSLRSATEKSHNESGKQHKDTEQQKESEKHEEEISNETVRSLTEFVVSQTVQKSTSLSPSEINEDKTKSNELDVSKLETEFRKVKGQHLQTAAPLRDYFRYLVYDCPGVKDHIKDNKARYDRYVSKRKKRKEAKMKSKPQETEKEDNQNEPIFTFESSSAVLGSSHLHSGSI